MRSLTRLLTVATTTAALLQGAPPARADGDINKVKHVLILMLENRTFDSYLGQLASKGFYGACADDSPNPSCTNQQVSALSCTASNATKFQPSTYQCTNSNPQTFSDCVNNPGGEDPLTVFHDPSYCTADTNHEWDGTHHEFNQCDPTSATGTNDGFYVQNLTAVDRLGTDGQRTEPERALGFYDDTDLPFYYSLADIFAIGDRYFCSILGPTIPNRMYLMAATSFGHVHTTNDLVPPPGGYTPQTGTIFGRMNSASTPVTWKDYFHDLPQAGLFQDATPDHYADINQLFVDLATPDEADTGGLSTLPQVAFIDPPFTQPQVIVPDANGNVFSSDEHPPKDIQFGQQLAARVVNAVLSSPHYHDTVLFITYDEHGGFYDHVPPPVAFDPNDTSLPGDCAQSGTCILPGACPADTEGLVGQTTGTPADSVLSQLAAQRKSNFCKGSSDTPPLTIPFDHLGIRVPFYAVSPFAKPHYVSHTVLDHTSLTKFIEARFNLPPMTKRDASANLPTDMFNFDSPPNPDASLLKQPGAPKTDPLLDPHCYEGVEVF